MKSTSKHVGSRMMGNLMAALVCLIPVAGRADWQLVWSDEFNQPDGSSPNPTNWTYDIGGGGYGNSELENYTSRTNNVRIVGGQLIIEADQENYGGNSYTSARMKTQGKWSWQYGRIEASIKIPRGQGIWPAFWMLGTNITSVNWPTCGEIDIMENIGKTSDQGTDHGTIHGPQNGGDYNGGSGVGGTCTLPGGAALADGFHTYAVEWTTNQIKWFLDTNNYFTATPSSLPNGGTWVFAQPQFVLLNLAVGGQWPGNPDATTVFPQQMIVDYVRVYSYVSPQTNPPAPIAVAIQTGGQVTWPTTNGTIWTLQATAPGTNAVWNNLMGPTAGDGTTNTMFDPSWPSRNRQYQVLQVTAGAGNLVANNGFETGSGSSVSNWTISGSDAPVRISTNFHGGAYCMSLAVTNPAGTANSSQIEQNIVNLGGGAVVPGQTYNFSFWASQISSGVSLVQNYRILWLGTNGSTISTVGWVGFTGGSGTWNQISTNNLVAPAGAVNADITIYATTGGVSHGYGNVLIDDVSLSYATPGQTNIVSPAVQSGIQVDWPSAIGTFYSVQKSSNSNGGNWSNLVASVAGTGGTNSAFDGYGTNSAQFYRVVELP